MTEMLSFDFMRQALLAGVLISIICGIMGTLAVANRMVFLSGGIAHAAYGGIGLAHLLGWPYLVGTIGFSMLSATGMALVTLNAKHRADAVIGAIWAMGMAAGIVCIDLSPGYAADLMSYLFGSILSVPVVDIWVMLIAVVAVCATVLFFYSDIVACVYDEEFARIRHIAVTRFYFLMVILLAVTVVLTIRIVGLIMVIALLTIPPFIAEKFTRTLWGMMVLACTLSTLFTVVGLVLSYHFNLTAGACIILTAGCGFFLALAIEAVRRQKTLSNHNRPLPSKAS